MSVSDVGEAKDAHQIQHNMVRVDGQRSAYLPIMKQGGDTNTIQVVDGIRSMLGRLFGVPKNLVASGGFRSIGVRQRGDPDAAARRLDRSGAHQPDDSDLFWRACAPPSRCFLSIPLSALTTFVILYLLGGTVNTMILGGLALAFSRIIDNSVISLENIYRHLEEGASPERAAAERRS